MLRYSSPSSFRPDEGQLVVVIGCTKKLPLQRHKCTPDSANEINEKGVPSLVSPIKKGLERDSGMLHREDGSAKMQLTIKKKLHDATGGPTRICFGFRRVRIKGKEGKFWLMEDFWNK